MILLDTTVLVHAVGEEHPLREPCRRMVDAIGAGLAATTTVEVIQEFAHVRARRLGRQDAVAAARSFVRLLAPLRSPNEDHLRRGLDLFSSVDSLGAFDAVLAATALGTEAVTGLASADRAFAAVPDLVHLDPGDPDFLRVLGSA